MTDAAALDYVLDNKGVREIYLFKDLGPHCKDPYVQRRLRACNERLRQHQRLLDELSPRRVLARGFSITRDANGALVRSAAQVSAGDLLHTELERGRLDSRVLTSPELAGEAAVEDVE